MNNNYNTIKELQEVCNILDGIQVKIDNLVSLLNESIKIDNNNLINRDINEIIKENTRLKNEISNMVIPSLSINE